MSAKQRNAISEAVEAAIENGTAYVNLDGIRRTVVRYFQDIGAVYTVQYGKESSPYHRRTFIVRPSQILVDA